MSDSVSINSAVAGETKIGANTSFKGTIQTDKPVIIDGRFEGIIESTNEVLINEGAYFDGTLTCSVLDLKGEAKGNVTCSQMFKFALTGKFSGDAATANVDIQPGCNFDGGLKIIR